MRNEHPSGGSGGRPAALLAVRLSPADVGRRVTVRHRHDATTLTDVVGVLRRWHDGVLQVERRDGALVEVRSGDVVAAKVVAPEVAAETMQAVAERGWPPFETATLGDWTLRWSDGVTGRANSVRVAGWPGTGLGEALAHVERWYADRGAPALLQVPVPSAYDEALDRAGWGIARRTVLRTGGTEGVLAAASGAVAAGLDVRRADVPSAELLELVDPGLDPAALTRILTGPDERVFVEVRDADGALLGTGRASATAGVGGSGRWAGVTSIATVPAARRRGVATLVMAELARWSLEHDCPRTYLQSLATNEAASALYERLGMPVHHAYVYRSPTPGAVSPL
ncbi:MAG: GNAT family N-acetyltransferase [Candidatus Nanopelagicales bacterium]